MKKARLDTERLFLNKWEMHKALYGENVHCRMPATAELSKQSLVSMLQRFRRLYVKPVNTWGGTGIVVVEQSMAEVGDSACRLVNTLGQVVPFPSIDLLFRELEERYNHQSCVVQQAAPVLRLDERPFDIRVLMQRDIGDEWTFAGSVARVGAPAGIVSNVAASGGYVTTISSLLRTLKGRTSASTRTIRSNLKQTGYAVARILDAYHPFEEIGLDVGLDAAGQLWLIEVNTNDTFGGPSHELFAQLPDQTLYRQVAARPLARRLRDANQFLSVLFDLDDRER